MNQKDVCKSILFLLLAICISCKKNDNELSKKDISNLKYEFSNFMFFNKTSTLTEIKQKLEELQIKYDSSIQPYDKECKKTRLKIGPLNFIEQTFPKMEIIFVDDTITNLIYDSRIEIYFFDTYIDSISYNDTTSTKFNEEKEKNKNNNFLFKEIYIALTEKYGSPQNEEKFTWYHIYNNAQKKKPKKVFIKEKFETFDMNFTDLNFDEFKKYAANTCYKMKWKSATDVQIEIDWHKFIAINKTWKSQEIYYDFNVIFNKHLISKADRIKSEILNKNRENLIKKRNNEEKAAKAKRKKILDGI